MTTTADAHTITSQERLRAMYGETSELVARKKVPHITPEARRALDMAPFFILATADSEGRCDASPRGGPPGLLQIIDDTTIAFPDLTGNRLIDSLQNIVDNPRLGLLVMTPGSDDTIRIDGRAHLTVDPSVLSRWDGVVNKVKLAVVVSIDNVFVHCAMAFRRSAMWDQDTWGNYEASPDLVVLFNEMTGAEGDTDEMRVALHSEYGKTLQEEAPDA